MPSIIFKKIQKPYFTSGLILLCSGILMACGGSSTAPIITPLPAPLETPPKTTVNLTINMPMDIQQAKLDVFVHDLKQPLYQNQNFSGFEAELPREIYDKYKNKMLLIKLSGDANTMMYDPILHKYVPFNGAMHYLAVISSNLNLYISPASEAIYQRSIVRSNQFNFDQVDISLINSDHLNHATNEIRASLNDAFINAHTHIPKFQNRYSITTISTESIPSTSYTSLFMGLGYMKHLKNTYPETINTYLEVAQILGTDLRDGYLDGRTIHGDSTAFKPLVNAPINTNVQNNTHAKIGEIQKNTREKFGQAIREATLSYAIDDAYQVTLHPKGIKLLEQVNYYQSESNFDSTTRFRWNGAGDYRQAFGLMTTETCSNGINPCRQGLNMDDLKTHVNDADYLIGTHQLNQCTIHFYPSGDVSITKANRIYRSSINRDLSDNLQQINNDPTHYILNVGASENKPAYFLQFEIKDMNIIKARTGYNYDIYATTIETPEMDCGS